VFWLAATGAGLLGAIIGYGLTGFGLGGACGYFDGGPEPDEEWFCEGAPLDLAIACAVLLPLGIAALGALRRSRGLIAASVPVPLVIFAVAVAIFP